MDFDLCPTITLRSRSFNALVAPANAFVQALNHNLDLQRRKALYVTDNFSSILCNLDRGFTNLEIRRMSTIFQLMAILEEANHSLIIVEHDPALYECVQVMIGYVSGVLKGAAKNSIVLLYASHSDPHFEELIKNADCVFLLDEDARTPSRLMNKAYHQDRKSRSVLEAFS